MKTKDNPQKVNIMTGRSPIIEELEEKRKREIKARLVRECGERGFVWRSGPMTMQDFLDGKENKPRKVSLEEVLEELDKPEIS